MLLVVLCSLTASAQDVIVKKTGDAVSCRVVEVGKSVVVYKLWSDLEGENYAMSLSEVASIRFENGEKQDFTAVAAPATPVPSLLGGNQGPVDDAALVTMANRDYQLMKAKRLKRIGLACGSILSAAGLICTVFGATGGDFEDGYVNTPLLVSGVLMIAGGITMATLCQVKSNRLKQNTLRSVRSTPVWQNDFRLKNGAVLSTGVHSLRDNVSYRPAVGLGLAYNF